MRSPGKTWLFDLDNTLHQATPHIFPHINRSMTDYIERHLGVDRHDGLGRVEPRQHELHPGRRVLPVAHDLHGGEIQGALRRSRHGLRLRLGNIKGAAMQ